MTLSRIQVILVLFILGLGSAPIAATASPGLETYESKYYTIRHNLPDEQVRRAAEHMDLVFREYSKRFAGFRSRRKGRQNLYLLKTKQDYVDLLAGFGINGSASGGMFFYGPRGSGLATYIGGRDIEDVFPILQHEGLHQFVRNYMGDRVPLWLNEGLAEYFEQARIVKGKVKTGIADPNRIAILRKAIEADVALPFDSLINISSQQWHANMLSGSPQGYIQYVQSWSIVHFLVHDSKKLRGGFNVFLNELSAGRTPDQAFRKAFRTDNVQAFHRRWEAYVLEELKPDDFTVAVDRMRFLAAGLKHLHDRGVEMPADLDALKQTLQDRGFHTVTRSHVGQTRTEASDESVYSFTDSKGRQKPFGFTPAADGLPPSLRAVGLRPMPTVQWIEDGGNVSYKIAYR